MESDKNKWKNESRVKLAMFQNFQRIAATFVTTLARKSHNRTHTVIIYTIILCVFFIEH